ncbi:MAG: ATP-dependent helicase [Clostridiales bacterium]|nr:ATP-dependent helicase [Clostridiales bacterium]
MNLTLEQLEIVKAVQNNKLVKVNACAGSGKTSVLVSIANTINPTNGIYLAYNKAIATEASRKFPKSIVCKTTHSLAYQNTIKPFNLKVGWFNWKSIKEHLPYELRLIIIDLLDEFCLSRHISFKDFSVQKLVENENLNKQILDLVKGYFLKMITGKIDITHSAYLKFYHLNLANNITIHNNFDLLMLDESGDINEVTLEIFKLLPSTHKVMVGDENQNIYTFNNTINGFKALKNEGIQLNMTKSFRCAPELAERIEIFCQKHIDPKFRFIGSEPEDRTIRSVAYITRNNAELVGQIIKLNNANIKYNLTRPAQAIFELLLIIITLKPGGKVLSKEWKHLQDDADEWQKNPDLKQSYHTLRGYIVSLYGEEPAIASALNILREYTSTEIFDAFEDAKSHEKDKGHMHTLCTSHSSKGLEFDEVIIGNDLNGSIQKITDERQPDEYSPKDIEAMMLAYVATTRAIKKLTSANLLNM